MDNFRTSEDLQVGKVINMYKDYMLQTKYEGKAKLLKCKEKRLSFMLYNENLLSIPENQTIDKVTGAHLPFTKEQKENNRIYARLSINFLGIVKSGVTHVNRYLYNLYLLLKEEVNEDLNNPKHLNMILEHYKKEWSTCIDERKLFFNHFSNEQIIRFIQQTCLKNWCHSIWREELWVVEFISDGFSSPFKTTRKIRVLICINPNEDGQNSDILHYITKDNTIISNADRKELRDKEKKKKEEKIKEDFPEEDTLYTDEEMEFINEYPDVDVYDMQDKIISFDEEGILDEFESQLIFGESEEEEEEENENFNI